MTLDEFRDENGELDAEKITEAYVLLDYENQPICICVFVNGAWITIAPFDPKLDEELKKILKGGKYTTRYLRGLIDIQDKFENTILQMESTLNDSKEMRI